MRELVFSWEKKKGVEKEEKLVGKLEFHKGQGYVFHVRRVEAKKPGSGSKED